MTERRDDLRALAEKLIAFTVHPSTCKRWWHHQIEGSIYYKDKPCTCGLDDILRALAAAQETPQEPISAREGLDPTGRCCVGHDVGNKPWGCIHCAYAVGRKDGQEVAHGTPAARPAEDCEHFKFVAAEVAERPIAPHATKENGEVQQ